MRVSHRMRHILSSPFNNNKRPSRSDPTSPETATTTTTATTTGWKERDITTAAVINDDDYDINNDNAVHIEVGDLMDSKSSSTPESDNDSCASSASDSEDNTTVTAAAKITSNNNGNGNGKRRQVRIITWHLGDTAIPPGCCRWTLEQERELQIAEQELARCQRAWSSEQEVWLAYVCTSHSFTHSRARAPFTSYLNLRNRRVGV